MFKPGQFVTVKRFFKGDPRAFKWEDACITEAQSQGVVVRFSDSTERFVYHSAIRS